MLEWITQRYFEPLLVMLLGLFLLWRVRWTLLGMWLFVAGVGLAGIEALVLEKALNALLNMRDDRIEGKLMSDMDKIISDQHKGIAPDTSQKSGGLVMASPELMRLSAQRLAAQQETSDAQAYESSAKRD